MSLGFHQRKSIWNCHLQNYSHFAYVSLCSRTLTSACWGSVWWLLCTPCSHFAWCGTSAGAGPAPPAWGPPPRAPPPSPRHDLGCDSSWNNTRYDIDGLVQERRNSSALAMELRLSCTDPSIWSAFALSCWLIFKKILWLYQNLFWPNLVWHLTCHVIVKILESCLITVCVLWSWFLFAIVLCVCARARVCEGERVWVFFVCLFCMPCVEWVWMFLVLLFYVIYSRTIASIANVFCWLYPTLNKVYLILSILSYLILRYSRHASNGHVTLAAIARTTIPMPWL